jgi:hypothetical protein
MKRSRPVVLVAFSAAAFLYSCQQKTAGPPPDTAALEASSALAAVPQLTILPNSTNSQNKNFELEEMTGFSVSIANSNVVRVYGTNGYQQLRWPTDPTGQIARLYRRSAIFPSSGDLPLCSHAADPRLWDSRCSTDAIGYFWKNTSSTNNRWNAAPSGDITTRMTRGSWPSSADYGTDGYVPRILGSTVNAVPLKPAGTGCSPALGELVWIDDVLPGGAQVAPANAQATPPVEAWTWVNDNAPGFPGSRAHISPARTGARQHSFTAATSTLPIGTNEHLFAWVRIGSGAERPTELMLQWRDSQAVEHRAYWGTQAATSPNPRFYAGPLPASGSWQRLSVRATDLGLAAGSRIQGMTFFLRNGSAAWDRAGKFTPGAAVPCPPKTGRPASQSNHAYNPDDFATGAANSKAVQVNYPGGTRWFMAFNSMIKFVTPTGPDPTTPNPSDYGRSAADNWRILWATSPDGVAWTIHEQILFRSPGEGLGPERGLLVTDLFVDQGFFYLLFTDVGKSHMYLARCRIDLDNPSSPTGYRQNAAEGWSVAIRSGSQIAWSLIRDLGGHVDFDSPSVNAEKVMPSPAGTGYSVKQGAIARIFQSANQGAASSFFGVSNLHDASSGATWKIGLWCSPDIATRPFTYRSEVALPTGLATAVNGWEFGFQHYPDNIAQNPRIAAPQMPVWITFGEGSRFVLGRHDATLANFGCN